MKHTKPIKLVPIQRSSRNFSAAATRGGIEPLFVGDLWDTVKDVGGSVLGKAACLACNAIPNALAQSLCRAAACR